MAKFQLNPGVVPRAQGSTPEHVRIGSISVFALVVIICLAVLAVLSLSTANASLIMSQRQADALSQQYLGERAAQEFLAGVDDKLSKGGNAGMEVVVASLDDLCAAAQNAAKGRVQARAQVVGDKVIADFTCDSGRVLTVEITVRDGTYRIDKWEMSAVQNEEPPEGQFYIPD